MNPRKLACVLTYFCYCSSAWGFTPLEGYFIATDACAAYLSKNKRTNPGDVVLELSKAYPLLGKNNAGGEYYQIRIDGVSGGDLRWVENNCGLHVIEVQSSSSEAPDATADSSTGPKFSIDPGLSINPESTHNVLALSWQPAFCESKPGKTECVLLNNGELPQTEKQLSIHGLWAQPRGKVYCGVSAALRQLDQHGQWADLPALNLSDSTREALTSLMPGTLSYLHRHEWIKHGSCHFGPGGSENYFSDTVAITQAINESGIAQFLQSRIGRNVATQEIRDQFSKTFGAGAGERIQFHCVGDGKRVLLQEILVNLSGVIDSDSEFADLLLAADPISQGCPEGIIDAAGVQ